MKTAFTTIAILVFVVASSASADHKADRHAPPLKLAHALHVQAHHLADEIDHHFSHSEWPHHQMTHISREVVSLERELKFGHRLSARRRLDRIEVMLHHLDVRIRRAVAVHDHGGARHITASVREMEQIVEALEHSLKHPSHGHRGRGHGDHRHTSHGHGDHVVARPGLLHIHRGGFTINIRVR